MRTILMSRGLQPARTPKDSDVAQASREDKPFHYGKSPTTAVHAMALVLSNFGASAPFARGEPVKTEPAASKSRPIDGIRDNSFLIEEAYNQEPGVVQHIWTAQFGADHRGEANARSWDLSFTQEWPVFSQTHQLSYTIPYSFIDPNRENESGIGDLMLHYRYQLTSDEGLSPAFSPRFSVLFPSGDEDRGFGAGTAGYELNLPLSKTLGDRLYVNLNAGFTYHPNVKLRLSENRRTGALDVVDYNLGASVIYAVSDTFHLMLEAVWDSTETLEEKRRGKRLPPYADRGRSEEVTLAPGFRWAWNGPDGLQIVPGIAFPIGLSDAAVDYGIFLYFSVEHSFLPQP